MRALVVHESMYGNTRTVAEAIAAGLREVGEVQVVPVAQASPAALKDLDLLVVGGPTHVHGMSRPSTRRAAVADAGKPGRDLTLEPGADGSGVRELLAAAGPLDVPAAAFDTRMQGPAWFTGRAAKAIARRLRRHGCSLLAPAESFLVTKTNQLVYGEADRAHRWATTVGRLAVERAGANASSPH